MNTSVHFDFKKTRPVDPLARTGRLGGGVLADIRRRLPFYLDDFRAGLNGKVLGSVSFLFFACLANAIAFGGLTSVITGGQIGTVEMIVATAVGGVCFALFSGQPLTLLGGTGPIVIFTGLLYSLCQRYGLPFLPVYAWVGVWSGLFMLVLALTDASSLMRFFTRFVDEIFAALVACIFIIEAVASMTGPLLDADSSRATALLTIVLALGTFMLARSLKSFQQSRYLHRKIRELISDFGPAIAIALMTLFALSMPEVPVERAAIPETFGTTTGRPWLVDMFSMPMWLILATIGPAMLVTVLLFLDQNITTRLVNSPLHALKKGPGYHLDLAIVGVMTGVFSVFGLPWIVAATVHSLNHVKSLATTKAADPETGEPEKIVSVMENRVSGLAIHALIACSIILLPLIKAIPMEVLFGLFLYMGISTLNGTDLFNRVRLWITDRRLYPQSHYVRKVPLRVIHLFTFVQVASLAVLWVLKSSPAGILFPLLIALLVPLRYWLDKWFNAEHIELLDSDEDTDVRLDEDALADFRP
jgi:hypothetical protein